MYDAGFVSDNVPLVFHTLTVKLKHEKVCVCPNERRGVYFFEKYSQKVVYLQQNKKKAYAEGNNCHAKTMRRKEKPIQLV